MLSRRFDRYLKAKNSRIMRIYAVVIYLPVAEGVPQAVRFRVFGGITHQYSRKTGIHRNREN